MASLSLALVFGEKDKKVYVQVTDDELVGILDNGIKRGLTAVQIVESIRKVLDFRARTR